MGYLIAYCKKCDSSYSGFILNGYKCVRCDTFNTTDDTKNSLFNNKYFPKQREKEKRKEKIKKLLDE